MVPGKVVKPRANKKWEQDTPPSRLKTTVSDTGLSAIYEPTDAIAE
jgi:hypothetical protein